jgi:hypothetical protein
MRVTPIPDYTAQLNSGIRGKKIGVAREFFFADCDPDVVSAVEAALDVFRDLGATVSDIPLPDMQAARAAGTVILFAEAAAYHAADLCQRPYAFSDEVRALLEMGGFYTAVQYVQAQRLRRQLTAETQRALAAYDAMVMPTSPVPATPITPEPRGHAAYDPATPYPLTSLARQRFRPLWLHQNRVTRGLTNRRESLDEGVFCVSRGLMNGRRPGIIDTRHSNGDPSDSVGLSPCGNRHNRAYSAYGLLSICMKGIRMPSTAAEWHAIIYQRGV